MFELTPVGGRFSPLILQVSMPRIILPFHSAEREIRVPEWGIVRLKAFQILVFVSVTEQGHAKLPGHAPIFPALFDTGNSLCFTLSEEQLKAGMPWGMQIRELNRTFAIRQHHGDPIRARGVLADVWLHGYSCNDPPPSPSRDSSVDRLVMKLSLAQDGIAYVPKPQPSESSSRRSHAPRGAISRVIGRLLRSIVGDRESQQEPQVVVDRLRDPRTDRLALPHLPLLGLRALCLNSLRAELICNLAGGTLTIDSPTSESR